MAIERTLSIIKPDAVAKNVIGQIYARFEGAGLKVIAARMAHLSKGEAEAFYAVHKARPFFNDLVKFMISGPVMIQVLEGPERDREEPRADGRDRSEEGRQGHDPRRLRRQHRRQFGARLGCAGNRRGGSGVLLPGHERLLAIKAVDLKLAALASPEGSAPLGAARRGAFADPELAALASPEGSAPLGAARRGAFTDPELAALASPEGSAPLGAARRGAATNLLDLDHEGLVAFCAGLGEKRFRATQLFRWIHQKGARDFAQMSDLAKSLRDKLADQATITPLNVLSEHVSADGTVKWLFDVGAGDAIETVFIPEDDRGTLCISSQAGCAVGCRFCSTGHQGFSRNLSTGEIVAQLWHAEHALRMRLKSDVRVISNVVMMGMGEPLQNYTALVPALRVMLDDHGYGLSRRRVTVSTSGVVPMIDRLRDDCPVALAVSLHAPDDALRDDLVPINRKYPIAELLEACKRYLEAAPRDFITFEYCMLDGVNDSAGHAHALLRLVRAAGVACKFNLIPFNPFPASGLERSPRERILAFADVLQGGGIVTTIRKTRGDDIDAACGQLAGEVQDRTRVKQRLRRIPVVPMAS